MEIGSLGSPGRRREADLSPKSTKRRRNNFNVERGLNRRSLNFFNEKSICRRRRSSSAASVLTVINFLFLRGALDRWLNNECVGKIRIGLENSVAANELIGIVDEN